MLTPYSCQKNESTHLTHFVCASGLIIDQDGAFIIIDDDDIFIAILC